MSFKEFHHKQIRDLQEALNSKVDYRVVANTEELFKTEAIIGERKIVFEAYLDNPDDELWDVSFVETTKDNKSMSFDTTGSGNELEVFSMIRSSMEELVKEKNPRKIKFTAWKRDNATRANLYERMLRRFAADRFDIERGSIDRNEDVFILTRKD